MFDNQEHRSEYQQEKRISVDPVLKPSHGRQGHVLSDGESGDIAPTPLVEVARRGVMDRVVAPPLDVGRKRHDPGDETDDIIPPP